MMSTYTLAEKDIKFFDIIEPMGWGTKSTDYKQLRIDLLSVRQESWLSNHCSTLTGLLAQAVKDRLGETFCSDGWSDTMCHIIGLGRHEFLKCMYDPQLILDRYESGDYKESFAYCLPSETDIDKLYVQTHSEKAASYLGQLVASEAYGFVYTVPEDMKQIQNALVHMVMGHHEKFLPTKDAVLPLLEKNRDEIGLGWAIDNLYGDVETYSQFF